MSDTTGQPHSTGCFPKINLFKKDDKWVSSLIDVKKFLEVQRNLIANLGYPKYRTDNTEDQKKK